MANNVYTTIEFTEINDAAYSRLIEMSGRIRTGENHNWFSDIFVEGSLTYDDTMLYSWTTENLGTKWCYIEDIECGFDIENPYIRTCSAWSPPIEGVELLLEYLTKLDPNMITSVTYEDEMPNFMGWCVYKGDELIDSCQDEADDIRNGIFAQHPNLAEGWDDEEEDWLETEEGEQASDLYNDVLYEWISEEQSEGIADTLRYISGWEPNGVFWSEENEPLVPK